MNHSDPIMVEVQKLHTTICNCMIQSNRVEQGSGVSLWMGQWEEGVTMGKCGSFGGGGG